MFERHDVEESPVPAIREVEDAKQGEEALLETCTLHVEARLAGDVPVDEEVQVGVFEQ